MHQAPFKRKYPWGTFVLGYVPIKKPFLFKVFVEHKDRRVFSGQRGILVTLAYLNKSKLAAKRVMLAAVSAAAVFMLLLLHQHP